MTTLLLGQFLSIYQKDNCTTYHKFKGPFYYWDNSCQNTRRTLLPLAIISRDHFTDGTIHVYIPGGQFYYLLSFSASYQPVERPYTATEIQKHYTYKKLIRM